MNKVIFLFVGLIVGVFITTVISIAYYNRAIDEMFLSCQAGKLDDISRAMETDKSQRFCRLYKDGIYTVQSIDEAQFYSSFISRLLFSDLPIASAHAQSAVSNFKKFSGTSCGKDT